MNASLGSFKMCQAPLFVWTVFLGSFKMSEAPLVVRSVVLVCINLVIVNTVQYVRRVGHKTMKG